MIPLLTISHRTVTDAEFDILDELYFVASFPDLQQRTRLSATDLGQSLASLLEKGLIRCFWPDPDTELAYEPTSFGALRQDCYFLASKEGLVQHNTR